MITETRLEDGSIELSIKDVKVIYGSRTMTSYVNGRKKNNFTLPGKTKDEIRWIAVAELVTLAASEELGYVITWRNG